MEHMTSKSTFGIFKIRKLLNLGNMTESLTKSFSNKLYPNNSCFHYEVSKHCNYKDINACVLNYIKKWFCLITKEKQHLDLSYGSIKDLLSNDELKISTEIEIFNAADCWIKHNSKERSKFAIELNKLVRLHFILSASLEFIFNTENSFSKCLESKQYTRNAICERKMTSEFSKDIQSRQHVEDSFYTIVYCGNYN